MKILATAAFATMALGATFFAPAQAAFVATPSTVLTDEANNFYVTPAKMKMKMHKMKHRKGSAHARHHRRG